MVCNQSGIRTIIPARGRKQLTVIYFHRFHVLIRTIIPARGRKLGHGGTECPPAAGAIRTIIPARGRKLNLSNVVVLFSMLTIRTIIPARGRAYGLFQGLSPTIVPIRTIIPARGRKRLSAAVQSRRFPEDKNHNPRKGTETKSKSSRHVFGIQMIRTIIPARGRKRILFSHTMT